MRSVDLRLIARAVLDALRVKVLLDVFGDSTLHGDRIHPAHVFIYTFVKQSGTKKKQRPHKTYLFFANAPPSSSPGQQPQRSRQNASSCRLEYDLESPSSKAKH